MKIDQKLEDINNKIQEEEQGSEVVNSKPDNYYPRAQKIQKKSKKEILEPV